MTTKGRLFGSSISPAEKRVPWLGSLCRGKAESRAQTHVQVRYRSQDGAWRVGRAAQASREGVFIEGGDLLPVGAEVELSVAQSDRPAEKMKGVGIVAWVCPKPDQFGRSRGMGVRLLEIMPVRWLQHSEAVPLAGQEQQEERGAA